MMKHLIFASLIILAAGCKNTSHYNEVKGCSTFTPECDTNSMRKCATSPEGCTTCACVPNPEKAQQIQGR